MGAAQGRLRALAQIVDVVLVSIPLGKGPISLDDRGGAGTILGVLMGASLREDVGGLLVVLALDLNPEQ